MNTENLLSMNLGNHMIQLDAREFLEEIVEWRKPKWQGDKLIACSPFRDDSTPSFFFDLRSGGWADSGASGTIYESGNIVKFVSLLLNIPEDDAMNYLIERFGIEVRNITEDESGNYNLDIRLPIPELKITRNPYTMFDYLNVDLTSRIDSSSASMYLKDRGIPKEVQQYFHVGRSTEGIKYYVSLGWRNRYGKTNAIKYRSTRGKKFFYHEDGIPIRFLLFGHYEYLQNYTEELIICEAEIDVLSWRTAGYNAVAIGSAKPSRHQIETLKTIGATEYILAGDFDDSGVAFNSRLYKALGAHGAVTYLVQPTTDVKDANDILVKYGVAGLRDVYEKRKKSFISQLYVN